MTLEIAHLSRLKVDGWSRTDGHFPFTSIITSLPTFPSVVKRRIWLQSDPTEARVCWKVGANLRTRRRHATHDSLSIQFSEFIFNFFKKAPPPLLTERVQILLMCHRTLKINRVFSNKMRSETDKRCWDTEVWFSVQPEKERQSDLLMNFLKVFVLVAPSLLNDTTSMSSLVIKPVANHWCTTLLLGQRSPGGLTQMWADTAAAPWPHLGSLKAQAPPTDLTPSNYHLRRHNNPSFTFHWTSPRGRLWLARPSTRPAAFHHVKKKNCTATRWGCRGIYFKAPEIYISSYVVRKYPSSYP